MLYLELFLIKPSNKELYEKYTDYHLTPSFYSPTVW